MCGGVLAAKPYYAFLTRHALLRVQDRAAPHGLLFCALRVLCIDLEHSDYLAGGTAALRHGLC
jgi:hypothetical protein